MIVQSLALGLVCEVLLPAEGGDARGGDVGVQAAGAGRQQALTRRRSVAPAEPKPAITSAQVVGSGMPATTLTLSITASMLAVTGSVFEAEQGLARPVATKPSV